MGSNLIESGTDKFALIRGGAAQIGTILLAVIISISTTAGCSLFNSSPVEKKVVPRPPVQNVDPYVIGRDDELEIIVWTQPQLSGKVIVASDGTIAMPLIGRVPAAGLTPDNLKAALERHYSRFVHVA